MPHMVRVYIRSVAIGVLLSCCFVAMLLVLDVAQLRRLILNSDIGWLAVLLMVVFNTIIFGGVQFALAVMGQAETSPPSGRRSPVSGTGRPVKVRAVVSPHRKG